MIQLRNVPDGLHRKLKARAAEAGMSLSEYILRDVRSIAERPTPEELKSILLTRKPVKLRESPAEAIRAIRNSQ
jgi:plasmid stability protein